MAEIKRQGSKSGVWKLQNSIWLILTFIPFIQWSAFFYIANRTDCKKFRIVGNVVLAADMITFILWYFSTLVRFDLSSYLRNICTLLLMLIIPFSIIAGIICLPDYWKALQLKSVHSGGIETITGKSHWWEIKKTLWVLLGFVPFIFYYSYIFPAYKMKKKLYWGYVAAFGAFSIICTYLCLIDRFELRRVTVEIMLEILLIMHFFSLSLLMNIRAKYLKFIANEEVNSTITSLLKGKQAASETKKSDSEKVSSNAKSDSTVPMPDPATSIPSHTSLNINTCSEEELAALPGLNIIDAKKTISLREKNGDFESIEEFITALHIKPHIAAHLYDHITVQSSYKPTPKSDSSSRKIDL